MTTLTPHKTTRLLAGTSMYDSDAILQYLFSKYGPGSVPLSLRLGPLTTLTETLAVLPR